MDFEKIKKAVAVSALFHDIGKFWQRAVRRDEGLSSETKKLEAELCPDFGKYRHVLWTSEFFEQFENVFPIDVSESLTGDALDNVKNLASRHHAPKSPLQVLIQQADWLSSGMDRTKAEDVKDEESGIFREKRLISVFSRIGNEVGGKRWVYNLTPLKPDESVFPFQEEKMVDLTDEYGKLWKNFVDEFKLLGVLRDNFNIWLASALSLIEKYAWCIPSSTVDVPDVSLYDHLKTTCAIAVALLKYHFETGTLDRNEEIKDRDRKKFIFISGDVSGIQDFIYKLSVTNVKGASRILRARSFYIQAITEGVINYILNELGLVPASCIMNAGGRFIILAPNVDLVKSKMEKISEEISLWFYDEFRGVLSLNISDDVEISGNDLMRENFSRTLKNVQNSVEMEKRRKFMSILKKGLRGFTFDDMFDDLRKAGHCRYCGVYPAVEEIKDEEGEAIKVCRKCKSFVDIGRWLTDVEAISYAGVELRKERSIQILGGKVYLNFHEKLSEVSVGKSDKIYHLEIFKYKDGFVYPVKFIANYVPRWGDEEKAIYEKVKELKQDWESAKGRIKTFGEIAKIGTLEKDGNEEEGKPMLGILKADVDNLGKIFSVVFSKNMSISKYVTLSRGFDFYFSAFLDELVRKGYKNIYIVYSGGDDLLFVGEWKEIFDFAVEMYKKFRKYTTENENITLSAGIALVGPKYPINRGALMADEFLDRSKSFKENKKVVKDSLTVFNTTVRWEFLDELNEWRDKFEKWLESKDSKVKTTFLHRLLMYQKMAKSYYEDKDPKGLRFTYLLKYDVARNIIEVKDGKIVKGEEERDKLFELVDNNLKEKYKKLWLGLSIPISYVLYKYRGKKIKKKED